MKMRTDLSRSRSRRASVLVMVLWMSLGLVSIVVYFANSTSFELRASENRLAGVASEETIDGAARYLMYVLGTETTNGYLPDPAWFRAEAAVVGESRFWLIGRDTNDPPANPNQVFFGLVDEASKLNLNATNLTTLEVLEMLPRMTYELAASIISWRAPIDELSSEGAGSETYSLQNPPYFCKTAPFESVDELKLVYGADTDTLVGEDINRNGVLDPTETDFNRNALVDPGVLEYVTVYSREPNLRPDGSARLNVRRLNTGNSGELRSLLETNFGNERANQILAALGLAGGQGGGGGGGNVNSRSPLEFYARSGMTLDEFAVIADSVSVTTNNFIEGRVNVNTASAAVLACLPGLTNRAPDLIAFRLANPTRLTSVAWVFEALGLTGQEARQFARQLGDRVTTRSYQFTADIAAVGPYGRGYRRVKFVFDTSEGSPKVLYRRELTHLGWALGREVREDLIAQNNASY